MRAESACWSDRDTERRPNPPPNPSPNSNPNPKPNPCPVALVSTFGCFRPPPTALLVLLTSALSGTIIPGSALMLKSKRSLVSQTCLVIPQEKRHRLTHTQTFSLVPRRARARAAGERRFILVCTHSHEPTAGSTLKNVGPKSGLETSKANDTHFLGLLQSMSFLCCYIVVSYTWATSLLVGLHFQLA